MTEEEIEAHHETLVTFLDAVLEGGPVPHEIAAAAWEAWAEIDAAVTGHLEGMKQTILGLETELSRLNFERLPTGGTA